MRSTGSALLRACLLAFIPIATFAQTEPVIVEAETGTLDAATVLTTGVAGDVTYVTTTLNATDTPLAPRISTLTVTFPAAGNYELYARYLVGPGGANDDSWYFGQGFGEKVPGQANQWALQNETNTGFTNPTATVLNGGNAPLNVFKWVKITGSQGPAAWVVPADALTQTFQWASREDGMQMDKFAFGRPGVCYTVANLDLVQSATGTCPPPPPPEPPPYTRTDPPIATGLSKYLGAAHNPGTNAAGASGSRGFANYWNQVTPENGGKWGTVEGVRDVMNWAQADAARDMARNNGFPFKWHTLFWGNQQPGWLENPTNGTAPLTAAEKLEEIHEWLAAIRDRYGDDIDQIEVVNEPLHDPPTSGNGNYIDALGGSGVTGWDWIITAFTLAREYFPNAELLINDYSITNDGNATTRYIEIINLLKERGLIDAIGDQAHAFSTTEGAPMPNHRANLDRLAATGLPIYITELDVDGVLQGVLNHDVQLAAFQRIFPVFWEHPAVKGVTIWGYVQGFHWRNQQGAWLLYANGGERPALQWLIRYVQNKAAVVTTDQVFPVSESAAGGTAIGTVLVTDADAGTTFSAWQIDSDASGKFAIDPALGTLSLKPDQTLDFEGATSYTVTVSVYDGYVRSAKQDVKIQVTNENDNVPVAAARAVDIDGYRGQLGLQTATDADDTNQAGYTTFQNWTIVEGNAGSVFKIKASTGAVEVARPLSIDWRKSSYTLLTTVSDGANTSTPVALTVNIPKKVTMCLIGLQLEAPKATAPLLLWLGAGLGPCKAPR
jgi:endo-1,4-beta-xylanase